MSKPQVNEQGVPVRRGLYDYETRGGKLQDVNRDNQVSFADTWIGDMLGFDGQGGVQGPSMRDSMGGARRRAIEVMQAQGVPMTQANLARAMSGPGGAGAASDLAQPGTVMHENQPVTAMPLEDDGSVAGPLAAAATGAAAGAYAAKRLLGGKPLQPDANGNVRVPVPGGRGGTALVPAAQADADGWAVVGLNYPDGGNALPAPSRIDMIDGTAEDVTDGNRSAAGPATPRYADGDTRNRASAPNAPNARPVAGDAATRPIGTEEIIAVGPDRFPQLTDDGSASGVMNTLGLAETGVFVDGAQVMQDVNTGQFRVTDMNGKTHVGPNVDLVVQAARNAVRAAIR